MAPGCDELFCIIMDVLLPAFGGSKPPLRCAWVGAAAWSRRSAARGLERRLGAAVSAKDAWRFARTYITPMAPALFDGTPGRGYTAYAFYPTSSTQPINHIRPTLLWTVY
jgi:hypothetical protein